MTAKKIETLTVPDETRLDDDVTKPATTAPGDGPADTTDPAERASSVVPQPGDLARAVGTVSSAVPLDPIPVAPAEHEDDEHEEYELPGPDGKMVRVRRNLRTGKSERV